MRWLTLCLLMSCDGGSTEPPPDEADTDTDTDSDTDADTDTDVGCVAGDGGPYTAGSTAPPTGINAEFTQHVEACTIPWESWDGRRTLTIRAPGAPEVYCAVTWHYASTAADATCTDCDFAFEVDVTFESDHGSSFCADLNVATDSYTGGIGISTTLHSYPVIMERIGAGGWAEMVPSEATRVDMGGGIEKVDTEHMFSAPI